MDTMEVNKGVAAILVAGIVFFLAGTFGVILVHQEPLKEAAIKIEGVAVATTGGQPQPVQLPPLAPLLASADAGAGEAVAKKVCAACHTFNQGGKAGVGPNLYNVLGAPHGHMEGFSYSAALKAKQGPWTYDELNDWLYKPSAYAPGTRMAFAGIGSAKERADVIAYLRSLSPNPEPLPSVEPQAPAGGKGMQSGSSQGTQPSASGEPAAESPTATRAQRTTPPPPLGAAGQGSPTPAAKSP